MVTLRRLTITQGLYFLVGIGLAANTFLLLFHIFILCLGHRPKQIDLVRCHLALVHVIMLLTLLFLMCPDLYESLGFQDDFKCKAFVFTNRVMRGLVICTTCLLTVLQALTLSHSNSWLARFKQRTPTATICSIFLFWVINLSVCIDLIIYTVSSNGTKSNFPTISKFCTLSPKISSDLLFLVTISRDTTVVGVMLLSSAYMVMLLLRHQKRSQHLTTSLSPRVSMEKRATLIILVLKSVCGDIVGEKRTLV
ncbi:putative vomeronasal receptor-like protein 4 [Sorex araneus]|uniref:putative vomeronasal receptor-like protein 4 n=1 Tax=Sorex araneus TaxID=42254 RepID=UPI002433B7BE|nr:putative vomeronasal receptor-like protein 4 [Sorex araneus]